MLIFNLFKGGAVGEMKGLRDWSFLKIVVTLWDQNLYFLEIMVNFFMIGNDFLRWGAFKDWGETFY